MELFFKSLGDMRVLLRYEGTTRCYEVDMGHYLKRKRNNAYLGSIRGTHHLRLPLYEVEWDNLIGDKFYRE